MDKQAADPTPNRFLARLIALTKKEFFQLIRDYSNLAMGILLPIILILLFGYGLSLDVKNVPVAVVLEDSSPQAHKTISGLSLSPYLSPVIVSSLEDARQLMKERTVDGVLYLRNNFSKQLAVGKAEVQLLVHGADANRARIISNYVQTALNQPSLRINTTQAVDQTAVGSVTIEQRLWFNSANTSTWFLVPGLISLIMTLVGAFLTALVMAREWERGTLEALFVTPVRPAEILISKIIPYFMVGMLGLALCLLAASFLFDVPMMGSRIILIFVSMLYLLVVLSIGLVISSITKNQFIASQFALLTSFLPATMLSGFIFDLRSAPTIIRYIGHLLPATHYIELLKTLFLAGNVWPLIIEKSLILMLYTVILLAVALKVTKKKLA